MERLQQACGVLFLCTLCCVVVPLVLGIAFVTIWASYALNQDSGLPCDTPIRGYLYGFIFILFWNTWCQGAFIETVLEYTPAEDGAERPLRVKLYQVFYFIVNLVLCILGLVWVFTAETCQTTAPHIFLSAKILALMQAAVYLILGFVMGAVYLFIWQMRFGNIGGPGGAPTDFVENLAVVPFVADEFDDEIRPKDCCICLEEFDTEAGDKAIVQTPCDHLYHKSCLVGWLKSNKSCPICRTDLVEAASGEEPSSSTATDIV